MERVFKLRNGDSLMCTEQAAVFRFSGPRTVLSTGANCGGMRYDLRSVFNYSDCGTAGVCLPMEGKSLLEHQYAVAKRLGLDPEHTTGLGHSGESGQHGGCNEKLGGSMDHSGSIRRS